MVEKLLNIALVGGDPLLYVLIALSIVSIAVALERSIAYLRNRLDLGAFNAKIVEHLNAGEVDKAVAFAKAHKAPEARVALEGLTNFNKDKTTIDELMESMTIRQQQLLDKRLSILGTIGSNAPFIGLLGTVLGIIKAFHDLALNTGGGPGVVMAGIAEALVATAVGLLVAIPAVVCFNYFKNRQKNVMGNIARVRKTILAFAGQRARPDIEPERKAA